MYFVKTIVLVCIFLAVPFFCFAEKLDYSKEISVGKNFLRAETDKNFLTTIRFGDKTILQLECDSFSFTDKFTFSDRKIVLGMYSVGRACAGVFYLFDIRSDSSVHVSDEFGNCHDAPIIKQEGDSLIIIFPGSKDTKKKYEYKDGKLNSI